MADPAAQAHDEQPVTLHPTLVALLAEIAANTPPDRRDALVIVRQDVPPPAERRGARDSYASQTFSAWSGRRSRSSTAAGTIPPCVRVFAPTLETEGYTVPGTVIETYTDDSPVPRRLGHRGARRAQSGGGDAVAPDDRHAPSEDGRVERVHVEPRRRAPRVGDALRARAGARPSRTVRTSRAGSAWSCTTCGSSCATSSRCRSACAIWRSSPARRRSRTRPRRSARPSTSSSGCCS